MELVEELLGSRGRIRVLGVVSESGELNISEVARSARMNHSDVEGHLEKIKKMGLLREKHFGNIRIFETAFRTVVVRFEKGQGVSMEWDGYEDRPQDFP